MPARLPHRGALELRSSDQRPPGLQPARLGPRAIARTSGWPLGNLALRSLVCPRESGGAVGIGDVSGWDYGCCVGCQDPCVTSVPLVQGQQPISGNCVPVSSDRQPGGVGTGVLDGYQLAVGGRWLPAWPDHPLGTPIGSQQTEVKPSSLSPQSGGLGSCVCCIS